MDVQPAELRQLAPIQVRYAGDLRDNLLDLLLLIHMPYTSSGWLPLERYMRRVKRIPQQPGTEKSRNQHAA